MVRIDGQMAYVEEDDGFETPILVRECVVISAASPQTQSVPQAKPAGAVYDAPVQRQRMQPLPVETPDGDTVNCVLAFEPQDIKTLSTTSFDAYIVNDSNYWMYVSLSSRRSGERRWTPRYDGLIEPNMQEFVWELSQRDLADVDRVLVQCSLFKRGRDYDRRQPVDVELKVDATKFVRLHCFRPHRYFDAAVIAFDIVRSGSAVVPFEPDAETLRRGMAEKERSQAQNSRPQSRTSKTDGMKEVVDLHASELLDSTAGLQPSDILNLQIDRFRSVMDANLRIAGKKLIFIHGKGEGVLRQALLKELEHRYKGHDVQDASFAEYGFGATQVTIHPNAAANAGGQHRRR